MKNILLSKKPSLLLFLSFALLTLLNTQVSWGQITIVNYDFNSGASYGALSPSVATNITSTMSSTEVFATLGGIASGAGAFTANATAGNAISMTNSSGTNAKYFQFQLGGTALSTYTSFKIYCQGQRSASGATTLTLAYSTNGTTYTNFGTTGSPGNGSYSEINFNLSSITAINSQTAVYFRVLASGASGTGTLRLDNFQIQATAVLPATPTTTSITPNSATVGGSGFALTVNGTNFISGASTVTWGGSNRATTFVSATELTAIILAADIASVGSINVGVTTTNAAAASNTQTFTINPASTPLLAVTGTTAHGTTCPTVAAATKTYMITNTGTIANNVVVSSDNPEFVVIGAPTSVAASGTANYDVIFTPTSAGPKTATITIYYNTTTQATTSSLTGTGTTVVPQSVSSTGASVVVNTTATLNGNATFGVCPATTVKGFVYSKDSDNADPDFADTPGTFTNVPVTLSTAGAYTAALTGLIPNTLYRFRAYVYNGTTYTYSTLQSFTTKQVASKLAFGISPPTTGSAGVSLTTFTVVAQRSDNSTDTEYTGTVTLTKGTVSGSANLTGNSVAIVAGTGIATFSAAQFDAVGTFNLTATISSGLSLTASAASSNIVITLLNATVKLWSSPTGTAWLTTGNWTGGLPTATEVAQFAANPTPGTAVNINGGTTPAAGIEITTRSIDLTVGNNSGSATSGTLTLNGGVINGVANTIIRHNGTASLTLQNTGSSGSGSNTMAVALGGASVNNVSIENSGSINISSVITGANPLTRVGAGSGVLILSNTANTYTGTTTITQGRLRLSPSTSPATFASPIVLNGGILSTLNITAATTITSAATLGLTESSGIDLGSNAHSLKFAASNGVSWTGSKTITVTGWTGTAGASGTAGKLFVGTTAGGLTAGQLNEITFQGYTNGTTILSTGEIVPKASFAVSYNANGGTGTQTDATPYNTGATVTVLGLGGITRTGYTFNHWNTAANNSGTSYAPADTFTISGDVTLYAQWTINTYTVTYDSNGGTGTQTDPGNPYNYNTNATVLGIGAVTNPGFTFSTWNSAADGSGTTHNPGSSLLMTTNRTLYAQWVSASAPACPSSTAVTPSLNQIVCQGTAANQLTANITLAGTTGTPTLSYQWYYNLSNTNVISGGTVKIIGATSSTYTPLSTSAEVGTRYYFAVGYAADNDCPQTDATPSLASNTVSVHVDATPATPTVSGGPTTFCAGGSVLLTSSSATGNTWSTGATTQSITVSTAGNYTVTVTVNGCPSAASAPTTVTVTPLPGTPTISADGATTFCAGGSVNLTASAGDSYLWSNGATTAAINVTTSGTYTVQVTVNGCPSASSLGTTVTVGSALVPGTVSPLVVGNPGGHLVISQVYGGGGNAGATYNRDFIEIFNPTFSSASLTGMSVQQASATGTSWSVTNLSGSIPAGGYYLVQGTIGANGASLPTANATGTFNFSSAGSKIALSSTTVAYTISCPTASVIDFIGFGNANCSENNNAGPVHTVTTATIRGNNGCSETGDNSVDFAAGAVNPRNSSSPIYSCATSSVTETICSGATPSEIKVTAASGSTSPYTYQWYSKEEANPTTPSGDTTGWSVATGVTTDGGLTFTPSAITTSTTYAAFVTPTGCAGAWSGSYRHVTVNPLPTASISGSTAICSGTAATITFTGTANATVTYKVNGGADQIIVLNGSGSATLPTGNLTLETAYTLVKATNTTTTCFQNVSGTATITINATPTALITPTSATIYAGGNTTLTASGGTSYSWNTSPIQTTAAITVSPSGTTTYIVTVTENGCSDTEQVIVTVNPLPTFGSIVQTEVQCSGIGLTEFTVTGLLSNKLHTLYYSIQDDPQPYSVDLPNTNAGTSAKFYLALTSASNGKILTVSSIQITGAPESNVAASTNNTVSIVVTPKTIPTFNAVAPICVGGTLTALPTTSNNGIVGTWAPALDNTQTTTYTFTPSGIVCATTATLAITVVAVPTAGTLTKSPNTASVCIGSSVSATATAGSGGAGTATDELEVSLNGGIYTAYVSGNPINTSGLTSVSIRTRRTATGSGCTSGYNTVSWTVNALPVVSISGVNTICSLTGTTTLSPTTGGTWISNDVNKATVTNAGVVTAGATLGQVDFTFTNSTTGCSATTAVVTITAQPEWYTDADNDGYPSNASIVTSCTRPTGGKLLSELIAITLDCQDNPSTIHPGGVLSSAIHPNATEVCFDNIDNDCDGLFSENCPPILTSLPSYSCGITLDKINSTITAKLPTNAGSYLIGYMFRITNLSTNATVDLPRSIRSFQLTMTDIATYSTSYSVSVAAVVNGELQPFSAPCIIGTPIIPTTNIARCGAMVGLTSNILCYSVNSAVGYQFEISLASNPLVKTEIFRSVPGFTMISLNGLIPIYYNTDYYVRAKVKVMIDGVEVWGNYGSSCTVTTPLGPEIFIEGCVDPSINPASMSTNIFANLVPAATMYRFTLINSTLGYEQSIEKPVRYFTLGEFNALSPLVAQEVYSVFVDAMIYGGYNTGKDCNIKIPVSGKMGAMAAGFEAKAYPNPFADNFLVDVTTESKSAINIKVYDMVGRLVDEQAVQVTDLKTSPIGDRYPSGVYNVVITQGDEVKTLRVVKR
jgi:uncharacterized repeat protein (TIGR02543 family)